MLKRFFSLPARLEEVMRNKEFLNEQPEVIMALWDTFHNDKTHVAAKTISAVQFKIIRNRLNECPSFIFPIKVKQSNVTLISEAIEENCFGFGDIENEDSGNYIVLRMFDEIMSQKNIVPIRADALQKGVSKGIVEAVMRGFVDFYVDDDFYESFVRVFNAEFEKFDYEKFLRLDAVSKMLEN